MKNKTLFYINLIYFITIATFVAVRILSSLGVFSALDPKIANQVFSIIIQVGVMFIVPVGLMLLIFKKGVKQTFANLGFKKITYNSIFIALAIGVLAFTLNLIVSTVFNGLISFFGYNPSGGGGTGTQYDTFFKLLQAIFFIGVLPSVFEEITHRGLLMKGYAKEIGYKRALIYSSILFGLMHLNVGQVFYAAVMGALMGMTVIVSGSIFPAMIVHFMNNAINVYLVYAQQNGLFGKGFYSSINTFLQSNTPIITFISAFFFLALLAFLIIVLFIQLFRENAVKQLTDIQSKVERSIDKEIFVGERMPEAAEIAAVNSVLVEKIKPILPDFSHISSPIDLILPQTEQDDYKPSILENMFFYGSVFLGVVITIFTFIWGVI